MTNIWDEKPKPVWVPRGYCSDTEIKGDDVQMLVLQEADAWLKKLKDAWDVITQAIELKDKIASPNVVILPREKYDELIEQLEAVKKTIKDFDWYDPAGEITKIIKILEVEE